MSRSTLHRPEPAPVPGAGLPAAAPWAGGRRTAALVATATWLLGAGTVASALLPPARGRLRLLTEVVPLPAADTATAVAATLGVLLCYLAGGLRRRKHRAWVTAVAVTVVVALAHLAKGLDVEEAAASVVVLALLVGARREFHAEGDPSSRWLAVRRCAQLAAIGTGLGMLLLRAYGDRVVGAPSLSTQLRHVLLGLVGVTGPVRFSGDRAADLVSTVLLGFGLLTGVVTAYLVLRPAEPACALAPADEARLRVLLARHGGRDSLGYFALRRDKSVVFSPTGKAAVPYRVVHGVLLASGDPIGDPEAWPGAMAATLELARRHAWVPAAIGCGERGATVWARHGLDAYELGDEAVLDVAAFGLAGRPMRGVRQAVSRVERAGVTAAVRRSADIPAAELAELVAVAEAWRGGGVERGFSMALSRIGDPADPECVVVTAHQDGVLRGLLHFVPWGTDGLSLDLMRRDRTADNGLTEFLVAALVAACPGLGVRRVSLNFAVLRAALERGERLGAGPVARGWRTVLVWASRWWQIETLYRFNAKFQPVWEPRYLCFPAARELPRIAVAALEAEAFLVRPGRCAACCAGRDIEARSGPDRPVGAGQVSLVGDPADLCRGRGGERPGRPGRRLAPRWPRPPGPGRRVDGGAGPVRPVDLEVADGPPRGAPGRAAPEPLRPAAYELATTLLRQQDGSRWPPARPVLVLILVAVYLVAEVGWTVADGFGWSAGLRPPPTVAVVLAVFWIVVRERAAVRAAADANGPRR